jgi:uncharacterized membrane protein YeiH
MSLLTIDLVLNILEAAAVIVSAIAGMIVASDKRMDLIGAFTLACVNAFGGGTIRDLLLDNRPFYWMTNWGYVPAIFVLCLLFVYSVRMFHIATVVYRRSVSIDAIGLALFTITGVGIALGRDVPLVIAVVMGVITGTSGGVLRDVLINEIPDLLRPGGLYASASLAGALVFVGALQIHGVAYANAALLGVAIIVLLRLVSVRLGVVMPSPQWLTKQKHDDS